MFSPILAELLVLRSHIEQALVDILKGVVGKIPINCAKLQK